MLLNEYELEYWQKNQLIVGIDEVGRGPICGPLVVCGVILPINYENDAINDSKKLTEKKRKMLFDMIIKDAIAYHIEIVDAPTVDRLNIYRATQVAMEVISEKLLADYCVTDAMPLKNGKLHTAIIKGDQKSISIAAASIIAKVIRDNIMNGYHILYPEYQYNKHKGYPTKKHLELLQVHGLKPFYRMSYGPCAKLNEIALF